MLFRWRKRMKKVRFHRLTRGIMDTPPMPIVDAPFSIISMISNSDVQMYLLSMKSFYSRIGRGKLIAIIDRDMPQDSRTTLERHFPGIRFAILEEIDTGICQRGGTWERLIYVLDHAENEYAIQVDCDTLTYGDDISEIVRCIEQNVAFTMSNRGRPIRSLKDAAADARAKEGDYVGLAAERLFDRYPGDETVKYVRGSSGFAGFAKGAFPRQRIEEFHRNMENLIGDRWTEWGSEQCGSNFAVANSPGAVVLPHPKYANFGPHVTGNDSTFVHFIGTYRYRDDYFAKRGIEIIAQLMGHKSNRKAA